MKKYLLLYKILFLSLPAFTQLNISGGTQWVNSGNVTVNIQDIDLINNGTFTAGNSILKFSGNSNNLIGGNSLTTFYEFQLSKNSNTVVSLLSNININSKITFNSGQFDLNQKNINLASTAILYNENENSHIIGPNGGEVIISLPLNKPNNINAGNLGAVLTSNSNLGTVTIKRGHKNQSGIGLTNSIDRYFSFQNSGNNINATLRFKYFDAELNSQNESNLVLFRSTDNGSNWTNQSFTSRDSIANYVEKTGLNTLALVTLSTFIPPPPPPVTGLVFTAKRINTTQVQLDWTSATETNMSGYEVQRRLDNEIDFTARAFVNSLAPGGNSNTPLSYSYTDSNSYNGTSYYRLKIIDLNNNFIYSDIKSVTGKVKGGGNPHNPITVNTNNEDQLTIAKTERLNTTNQKITVGPNPNNGNFWFSVSGIEKATIATLYSIDGKVIKQFQVSDQQQIQVNGVSNGMYLLKVPGIDAFKVVVQGSSNSISNVITSSPIIKN